MIPVTKILKGIRTVHKRTDIGPLFIWDITEKCDLYCAHCHRKPSLYDQEESLSNEKCLSIIEDIAKMNPRILLLAGGEPLLRKNVFDIIDKCKSSGVKVGLLTNGTLINKAMAQIIKDHDVNYVGISIDGKETYHDHFKGKDGSFKLSWSAIDNLLKCGIQTGVRFTLTKENKDDLIYILERSFESGVKRFCLHHLVYSGRVNEVADLNREEKREVMSKFFTRVKQISGLDDEFEVLTAGNHADLIYLSKMLKCDDAVLECINERGGCSAGNKVVYLDPTGVVYPCPFLLDEPMGNINDTPLLKIWNDTENILMNKFRTMSKHITGKCSECRHIKNCGGCRARAKSVSASLWDEDPGCYLNENETSHQKQKKGLEKNTT